MKKNRNSFNAHYSNLVEGKDPKFAIRFFWIIGIGTFLLLAGMLLSQGMKAYDYSDIGPVGDLFGGIIGAFMALIATLFTFLAFWLQYKANIAQTQQFHEQDIDTKIDRFENKFYELLHLHKSNLHEISIEFYDGESVQPRQAFILMYRELKTCFSVVDEQYRLLKEQGKMNESCTPEQLLSVAYVFFYFGVGPYSDTVTREMIGEEINEALYQQIRTELIRIQGEDEVPKDYNIRFSSKYQLFRGHQSRLGHYYRHLFQTVKFVVNQPDALLDKTQKKEYLRTLRAQLSNHEQVMLYYNALSKFGDEWQKNGYLTEYRMIHNLPLPLANFGVTPSVFFSEHMENDPHIFEWK